jgi:threonylcarbamoyladenosine tRNA methylthiotransferase MtaB
MPTIAEPIAATGARIAVSAEFHVHNLGCKLNRVESDALCEALRAAGGRAVAREEAHVVVVNTCTVTGEAETKTRKAIRQALAAPTAPWVIATGCAVAINEAAWRALGERVIAEPDRMRAQERALELLGLAPVTGGTFDAPAASNGAGSPRTRRGVKIQDGCDGACAYCIVRIARGAARSLPRQEIVEQLRAAEQRGIREVVLTGVNIGAWRDGDNDGDGLANLVAELLAATTALRIRLSSLEPQHADDGLLQLMANSRSRLCAHLHLPLQSGCDRTLADMARPYDSAFFAARVAFARTLMPQLALTTDLIVGFPGESDEDFEQSRAFCERMAFTRMHVFRYSRRPRTPAAARPDQVDPCTVAERAHILRELSLRLCRDDALTRVGTREPVLIERRGRGMSESYHRVAVPEEFAPGRLVTMRITGYRDTLLQAEL